MADGRPTQTLLKTSLAGALTKTTCAGTHRTAVTHPTSHRCPTAVIGWWPLIQLAATHTVCKRLSLLTVTCLCAHGNFVFATNTHSQACHIITKCTAPHADRREGDLRHQQRVFTSPVATAAAVKKRRNPASTPTFVLPPWQPARCAKHPSPWIQPLAEAQTQQTQNNQPPNRALAQFQT